MEIPENFKTWRLARISSVAALAMVLIGFAKAQDVVTPPTLYFNDDFTYVAISQSLWDMSQLTGPIRWYPPNSSQQQSLAGSWINEGANPACTATFFQGTLSLANNGGGLGSGGDLTTLKWPSSGLLSQLKMPWTQRFAAAQPSWIRPASLISPQVARGGSYNTFPYMWCGGPTRPSPIPPTGSFTFETAISYPTIAGNGTGFVLLNWPNATPSGTNVPDVPGSSSLELWADSTHGLTTGLPGRPAVHPTPVNSVHVYTLHWLQTGSSVTLTLLIDGVQVDTVTPTTIQRPNCIWIGNPVYNWWAPGAWSNCVFDYVRVTVP